jgi:hypothetical protein
VVVSLSRRRNTNTPSTQPSAPTKALTRPENAAETCPKKLLLSSRTGSTHIWTRRTRLRSRRTCSVAKLALHRIRYVRAPFLFFGSRSFFFLGLGNGWATVVRLLQPSSTCHQVVFQVSIPTFSYLLHVALPVIDLSRKCLSCVETLPVPTFSYLPACGGSESCLSNIHVTGF